MNLYKKYPDVNLFYAYRCDSCGRLVTQQEILASWDLAVGPALCPCGSGKVKPSNPKPWEELLLPRVWKQYLALKMGKVLHPRLDAVKPDQPVA